jgi:hypothetical protein
MSDAQLPEPWSVDVGSDAFWNDEVADTPEALSELVTRLLDKGVVIIGDITISVAGVDLVYLGLNAVLTSVSTARQHLRPDALDAGPDE